MNRVITRQAGAVYWPLRWVDIEMEVDWQCDAALVSIVFTNVGRSIQSLR